MSNVKKEKRGLFANIVHGTFNINAATEQKLPGF